MNQSAKYHILNPVIKIIPLLILSLLIGALGYSGLNPLMSLLVVFPVILYHARSRRALYGALWLYYSACLYPLLAGMFTFFDPNPIAAITLWTALVTLLPLGWLAFPITPKDTDTAFALKATAKLLIATFLPPFLFLGLGNPLLGASMPGAGIMGYIIFWAAGLTLATILKKPDPTLKVKAGILITLAFTTLAITKTPAHPPIARGINTAYAKINPALTENYLLQLDLMDQITITAKHHPQIDLIITPETLITRWTDIEGQYWQSVTRTLKETGTTALLGAFLWHNDQSYDNALIAIGEHPGILKARLPMPVGNWRPWSQSSARLNLSNENLISIRDQKVLVLFCYEQMLIWPYLTRESPNHILVASNLWWAQGTRIEAIMQAVLSSQARLHGAKALRAVNR